jgi:hypothetical protein
VYRTFVLDDASLGQCISCTICPWKKWHDRRTSDPLHCKKGSDFPVPSRDVTNQTWLVTSRQVKGKPLTFFYSVHSANGCIFMCVRTIVGRYVRCRLRRALTAHLFCRLASFLFYLFKVVRFIELIWDRTHQRWNSRTNSWVEVFGHNLESS